MTFGRKRANSFDCGSFFVLMTKTKDPIGEVKKKKANRRTICGLLKKK
jgi:hypothetical protein